MNTPLTAMSLRHLALALCCKSAFAIPAGAQAPQPAPKSIAIVADSIAAAGDTARAVAILDSTVRADRLNGAAWHQLGVLLWNQAKGLRRDGLVQNPRVIRLLGAADSSLRIATQVAPDSARFWMSLNQFNSTSGVSWSQFAAGGNATKALEAAERLGDSANIALASDAYEDQMRQAREAVKADSKRVAQVVKGWLDDEANA